MAQTFFFYDIETSGLNPRQDRIMQFAGQRTDMELNPIGEPVNELVKLSDDVLPSPEALLVTGITPQQTVADGYSEAEFAKLLISEVFTEGTIAVGFNNIRFDDEFIRHFLWRNFHDPYEWSWKDGRSRWDMLDVVRMTRALRPGGVEWPVTKDGVATNRLELLTKVNGIDHLRAHDAMSDVEALIAIAKLLKDKQPKLYQYLLSIRGKNDVKKLVNLDDKQPFVYSSGRYDSKFHKTTVAFPLTAGRNGNVLVYDLRHDPAPFVDLKPAQLEQRLFASWEERRQEGFVPIPAKELAYNRAPAVAPLGVLEASGGWERIGLSLNQVERNKAALLAAPHFAESLRSAFEARPEFPLQTDPEAQLYDGFVSERDRMLVEVVREADEQKLGDFHPQFDDERLAPLLLHYKARNFPKSLSEGEQSTWEEWRKQKLFAALPRFLTALQEKSAKVNKDSEQFVLQELQLWAESIVPGDDHSS